METLEKTEVQRAKEKTIWHHEVSGYDNYGMNSFDYDTLDLRIDVCKTNYHDFVMESIDETTTPRGVAPRCFVEFVDNCRYGGDEYWTISTWGVGGNSYKQGTEQFETEEEARYELFRRVEEFDFFPDDQRNTEYFESQEEAEEEALKHYASHWRCDEAVVKSILSKREKIDRFKNEIKKKEREEQEKKRQERKELAANYAMLIEPVAGESRKETQARLSAVLDRKIEGALFHNAVSIVRLKARNA